jgi:ATP/maltotriose-dependent transcriptional regulator MalT
VLVGGESGVGKSRLITEFTRSAQDAGARVLEGACLDLGGAELPYAPIVAVLRTLARETDRETLAELAGSGSDELALLLPELPARGGSGEPADPLAQSRLFEALLGLLARLGHEQPVVLVVEDMHWADTSTRSFLAFLVRNARRERLLLVGTYRSDELHRRHPLRQFLAEIDRVPAVERLEVARFTRPELTEQLAGILDAPAEQRVVDELFEHSQGNAFFAEELLAAAGTGSGHGVPDTLRDVLTLRVEGLSSETQGLLRTAAAAGTTVGHRLLADAGGLEQDALQHALREAIEHNVLVRDTERESYAFRHALLREALYDDLLPGERGDLHAALARALERDPSLAAAGAAGSAAERAFHWSAAHELPAALAASIEAGVDAERVWAFAEANRELERAVELWERVPAADRPEGVSLVELVRRAAEAAHLAGQTERALGLARRALELIDPEDDPGSAGSLHERVGRYLLAHGEPLQALEEYRLAASILPETATAERARILAGEGHILMLEGDAEAARGPCEQAIAIARASGDTAVECNALNTLGAAVGALGGREQGIALLEEAKRLADELGAADELARSCVNLGQILDEDERSEEAVAVTLEGWERLHDQSSATAPLLAGETGARLDRLGRWDEAAALLAEVADTGATSVPGSVAVSVLAQLETRRGDLDAAVTHLEQAQRAASGGAEMYSSLFREAAATVALAQGRAEDVRGILTFGEEAAPGYPVFMLAEYALALEAEAELAARARAGHDDAGEGEALERVAVLLRHTRALSDPERWTLGEPPLEALLQAELCELEAARARREAAPDGWAEYASRCEHGHRPFRAAYARLREAEAALVAGTARTRVAEALSHGHALTVGLGARPLREEIEELARRARVVLSAEPAAEPTLEPDAPFGLTARELDVLLLLAEGKTNREIGAALFMSPKTASVHVSHILGKLGVRSRVEAAGVAHRLGLQSSGAP